MSAVNAIRNDDLEHLPGWCTPVSVMQEVSPPRLGHRRSSSSPIDGRALARRQKDMLPALKRVKDEELRAMKLGASWTAAERRLEHMQNRHQAICYSPLSRSVGQQPHHNHRRSSSDTAQLSARRRQEQQNELVRLVPGGDSMQKITSL